MDALVVGRPDRDGDIVRDALVEAGFTPVLCHEVERFRGCFRCRADCLVVMSGLATDEEAAALCRWIRAEQGCEDALVLVVPRNTSAESLGRLVDAGADEFLDRLDDRALLSLRLRMAFRRLGSLAAHHEAEHTYEVLYNNALIGLFRIAISDGRVLACNEHYASIYGYRNAAHVMSEFRVTNHYIDPGVRRDILEDMLGADTVRLYETQQRRLDGTVMWIASSARINAEGGYIDGVAMDISQRREAEAERQKLQRHIEQIQKQESLGTLAGGVAHHLNNLLQVILCNANMARLNIPHESRADGYLRTIEQNVHRAADLSGQMLVYSGRGRFRLEAIDLNALLRDTEGMLAVASASSARLSYHLGPDLPQFHGDPIQIRQLVLNLVENSSEALLGESGEIIISTYVQEHPADGSPDNPSGGADLRGRCVCLEVSDTGCGMDGETRRKIFDPFFSTKHTGRGLGLAAVQGIVRGHNADITVRSRTGEGTAFVVSFPATQR